METYLYQHTPIPFARSRLDSGLTVYTAEVPSRFVLTRFVLHAGAMDDRVPGSCHFLEHLLCGRLHRNSVLSRAAIDAATSEYTTRYDLVGEARRFKTLTRVLAQAVFETGFSSAEVKHERPIILDEWRSDRGSPGMLHWYEVMYPEDPCLHHPVAGTPASLKRITPEVLLEAHARLFDLANAAFIVAGPVGHMQACDAVESATRTFPAGTPRPRPRRAAMAKGVRIDDHSRYVHDGLDFYISLSQPRNLVSDLKEWFILELLANSRFGSLMRQLRHREGKKYGIAYAAHNLPSRYLRLSILVPPRQFRRTARLFKEHFGRLIDGQVPRSDWQGLRQVKRRGIIIEDEDMTRGDWADYATELFRQNDDTDRDAFLELSRLRLSDVVEHARRISQPENTALARCFSDH